MEKETKMLDLVKKIALVKKEAKKACNQIAAYEYEQDINKLTDELVSLYEEQDEQDWYAFGIEKEDDNGDYTISYYCWLREETLVEFTGDYSNVVSKMYDWCKEHEYIKVEHEK